MLSVNDDDDSKKPSQMIYFADGSCDGSRGVRVGYAGQVAQFGHGRQRGWRLITDELLPHEIARAVVRWRHHQHPLEALRQTLPHSSLKLESNYEGPNNPQSLSSLARLTLSVAKFFSNHSFMNSVLRSFRPNSQEMAWNDTRFWSIYTYSLLVHSYSSTNRSLISELIFKWCNRQHSWSILINQLFGSNFEVSLAFPPQVKPPPLPLYRSCIIPITDNNNNNNNNKIIIIAIMMTMNGRN